MYNQVILIGNVGSDPVIKELPSAKVANFSLATNRTWTDNAGERQQKTEWHSVECWGKTADNVERMVTKGARMMVTGSLVYDKWEDDAGKHTKAKIRCNSFLMLTARRDDSPPF